jgi:sodium/hydrogen exchanger family protein
LEPIQLAAVLAAVILVASVISVELGLTVALIELALGVVTGNLFDLHSQEWLDFIAAFASIVLTFLAGMEVDPAYMRRRLEASVGIGVSSFAGPFVVASLVAFYLLDWTLKASLIAGTALSTTSLAVVYAVLVERGLTDVGIGKLLMSATFVTDLCTALALSAIFIKPNIWFPVFLLVSLALILALPRIASWFFGRYGDRVIEPEIKLVFACLLLLMVLADASNGHAVLPAFVLGLVMSRHYREHREEAEAIARRRLRLPDPVLLHQGRPQRLPRRRLRQPRPACRPAGGKDAAEDRLHLPARAESGPPARDLRHPADEHRADLRDDLLALRPQRRNHRRNPVLTARHGCRPLCCGADRDRRALVPSRRRRGEARRSPQRRCAGRGVRLDDAAQT